MADSGLDRDRNPGLTRGRLGKKSKGTEGRGRKDKAKKGAERKAFAGDDDNVFQWISEDGIFITRKTFSRIRQFETFEELYEAATTSSVPSSSMDDDDASKTSNDGGCGELHNMLALSEGDCVFKLQIHR